MLVLTNSILQYSDGASEKELQLHNGSAKDEYIFATLASNLPVDNFSTEFYLRVQLQQAFRISLNLQLTFELENGNDITDHRSLFPFNTKYPGPFFKEIATRRGKIVLHANKNYAVDLLKLSDRSFTVSFMLEAACLHPAWSQAGGKRSIALEQQAAGTVYECRFSFLFPRQEKFVPLMPWFYPHAIPAAFILTDHCDFDTEKKLRLFLYGNNNDGWLGRSLKITKGVFTLSSRTKDFDKNDSLEDAGYLQLIQQLHADGSEIVPHALKSKGQLDAVTFRSALEKIVAMFHPKTWIDHGSYLKYCYSQGAKLNPDYQLVDALKQNGFNNLWSFHDVHTDAMHTLNIYTNKEFSNAKAWGKVFSYFFRGNFMIAAHHFRSIIHRNYSKNIFTDFLVYTMAQAKGSFIQWKKNKKKIFKETGVFFKALQLFRKRRVKEELPYSNEDLLQYSEPVFSEERRPLAQLNDGDLLMFSTFETTHIKDIYNTAALDQLVQEYGLHIGHTYILNDLPYLAGIFDVSKKELRLSKQWIEFTEALSSKVRSAEIWNPNMGEYATWLTCLQNIQVTYTSPRSCTIQNNNKEIVEGFSFIIPSSFSSHIQCGNITLSPAKTDHQFSFYKLDLPTGSTELSL